MREQISIGDTVVMVRPIDGRFTTKSGVVVQDGDFTGYVFVDFGPERPIDQSTGEQFGHDGTGRIPTSSGWTISRKYLQKVGEALPPPEDKTWWIGDVPD